MRVGHKSPITPTILPRGSQAHTQENTGLHKATSSLLFQPFLFLSLSLLPGRHWHCNTFLASVHVPELNIGKVTLTAITNMGWVPLFFSSTAECVWVSLFKKHSHVCQRRWGGKNCVCLSSVYIWASVLAINLDWLRVCVCVCNRRMKPSYHNMSVCGPHHTETIIKLSCCTYVTQYPTLHMGCVYTGWPGPERETTWEERDKLGRGTLMSSKNTKHKVTRPIHAHTLHPNSVWYRICTSTRIVSDWVFFAEIGVNILDVNRTWFRLSVPIRCLFGK